MNYDFETIRAKLTGAHVSDNARRNRLYPTDVQILSVLETHQQRGPLHFGVSGWNGDIWSAGLLEYAPLTERQEKLQKAGKAWSLRRKLQITDTGKWYLADLHRTLAVRDCVALMAPIDISRLRVWQAYVEECCKVPFSVAVRVHQMEMSI